MPISRNGAVAVSKFVSTVIKEPVGIAAILAVCADVAVNRDRLEVEPSLTIAFIELGVLRRKVSTVLFCTAVCSYL